MTEASAPRAPTSPLWLVLLMGTALFINYIDRGNLAQVGHQLKLDLSLTNTQFGALVSAFYVTYTLAQLPAGWLSDRYGAKLILGVGAALWSLATLLTGFVGGFVSVLALRLVLGIGESAGFTSTSKLIAERVPKEHVAIANGVLGFGYLVGPAVGILVGGWVLIHYGWRTVFIGFGAVSLLWLIPWSRVVVPEVTLRSARPDGRAGEVVATAGDAAGEAVVAPTIPAILRQRALWGAAIGHFCGNYNFYFILAWLPTYLQESRGFSAEQMTDVASKAYGINAVAALFAGWAIDRWVRRGGSATFAHKLPMALAHILGIGCMIGLAVLPVREAIVCLFAYEVALGLSSPGYFAIPQIIAGPTAAARWVGIQNMIGNFPGWIAPLLTGIIIDATGSYVSAFVLAGVVNLVGFFGWVVVLPKIALIDWAAEARKHARPAAS